MATRRTLATVLAAALLLALPVQPVVGQPPTTARLGDSTDVVLAAVDVSRATFAHGAAEYAVIGRDDSFPDNLAATSLAGTRGPLLYTTGGAAASLRSETLVELQRVVAPLDSTCTTADAEEGFHVYLVGGTNAVSAAVEQQLVDANYCVFRLAGDSRYETAAAIASEVRRRFGSEEVLIARADDWADAATGGAYAAFADVPILVTDTGSLHPAAEAFLAEPGFSGLPATSRAHVLGGTAAISADVEDEVAAFADTNRVAGTARDLTALAIETQLWGNDAGTGRQLVNGYAELGWAYAFAAAPTAAVDRTPQVYTFGDVLIDSACAHLVDERAQHTTGIGPELLMLPQVLDAAAVAMATGSCDDEPVEGSAETLVFVVDDVLDPDAGFTPGLYVAETTGANPRLLRAGDFYGLPSWDPTASWVVAPEDTDGDGLAESIARVWLDGRHEILHQVAQPPGSGSTTIGNLAVNPRVTKSVEIAFEQITFDRGEGDPFVEVLVHSAKGGTVALTDSGSAQLSSDPYDHRGLLTLSDGGIVRYEDEVTLELVDLAPGDFAYPEWSADGDIAYRSTNGLDVTLPGANGGAFTITPETVHDHDWFPSGDRLAYGYFDTSLGEPVVAVYDLKGTNPGVEQVLPGYSRPEVSADGTHLALTGPDGIEVLDLETNATTRIAPVSFTYAYPPYYAAGS